MALNIIKKDAQKDKREELAKLLSERQKAVQAAAELERLILELGLKHESLSAEMPKYRAEADHAAQARKQAIDSFVLNKISQGDLDQARTYAEAARQKAEEIGELLEATARARETMEKKRPVLQQARLAADQAFWRYILEEISAEIRPVVDRCLMAYGAYIKSRTFWQPPQFSHFLSSIFQEKRQHDFKGLSAHA